MDTGLLIDASAEQDSVWMREVMKMMKIRIKKYFLPCFLPVIAVLCFVLVAPVFADMAKVDEEELARTKASVTGTPIKNLNCVEKDGTCSETKQDLVTSDKVADVSSPALKGITSGVIDLNQHINDQTTFQFHFGGASTITTGGITSVAPR